MVVVVAVIGEATTTSTVPTECSPPVPFAVAFGFCVCVHFAYVVVFALLFPVARTLSRRSLDQKNAILRGEG
jgi:hypothetical protein